jgi:ketosteroid isomerase-like protein
VSNSAPADVVSRLFEARATGDVRRVRALLDPDVAFVRRSTEGTRVEVDAHRIVAEDDEHVRVYGRIRVIERGSLTDSPAAWRLTVRGGRVVDIAPLRSAAPRLRHVA